MLGISSIPPSGRAGGKGFKREQLFLVTTDDYDKRGSIHRSANMAEPNVRLQDRTLVNITASIVPIPSQTVVVLDKDVNEDGISDIVEINYEKDKAKLRVLLGTGNANNPYFGSVGGHIGYGDLEFILYHILPKFSEKQNRQIEKYFARTPDGRNANHLDWQKVVKDYPILEYFLKPDAPSEQRAYVAILLRSPLFRKQLKKAAAMGVTLHVGKVTGYMPKERKVYLQTATRPTDFLVALPHELQHIDSKEADENSGVAKYIEDNIKNEMDANRFAFVVLEEIGFQIDTLWSGSDYRLYQAYKKGNDEFRKEQKRGVIGSGKLTYVERLFFGYQMIRSEGQGVSAKLLSPKEIGMRAGVLLKRLYELSKTKMGPTRIIFNLKKQFPSLVSDVVTNIRELVKLIHLLRKGADTASRLEALRIKSRLIAEIIASEEEYCRMINADRHDLHRYYEGTSKNP